MTIAQLPEPTVIDGRIMFTKVQMKTFGQQCYDLGVMSVQTSEPKKEYPSTGDFGGIFGGIFDKK